MESTLKLKPSSSSNKYPTATSPNASWTIEQLLFWSLDQYHAAAISNTNSHLGALRLQCENECDDVLMLHELAVNMKDKDSDGDNSNSADSGADGNKKNVKNQHDENMDPLTSALSLARKGVSVENENMDPQQHDSTNNHDLQVAATTNTTTTTAAPKSSNTSSLLIISILSGPHASQTYKLQPKHTHAVPAANGVADDPAAPQQGCPSPVPGRRVTSRGSNDANPPLCNSGALLTHVRWRIWGS